MPWLAAVGAVAAAAEGSQSSRDATRANGRGIQQGTIAVEGGVDQALARIDAGSDQSLTMNRTYSDPGIGAMANVNAMLGIQGASSDISQAELDAMQKKLSKAKDKNSGISDEIARLNRILSSAGGFNKHGYRIKNGEEYTDDNGNKKIAKDVEYSGMHRDQLQNRLASLREKKKTLATVSSGIQKNYDEAKRTFTIQQQATQNATNSGVQQIKPFEFNADNFNEDPSYQFRKDQALEGVDRRMAAGGFLNSGNRATAIADYSSNLASTEYQNAFERSMAQWRSQFDVLNANLGVAQMGQQATGTNIGLVNGAGIAGAQTIMTGAGQIAGLHGAAGANSAAGIMGANSAMQQGIGDLAYSAGRNGWFGSNDGGTNDTTTSGGTTNNVPYDPSNSTNSDNFDGF